MARFEKDAEGSGDPGRRSDAGLTENIMPEGKGLGGAALGGGDSARPADISGFSEASASDYGATTPLIGDLFLQQGLIDRDDLAQALRLQRRWGSRIGDVLMGLGHVKALDFFKGISAQRGLPFVNLISEPPDPALLREADVDFYIENRCLPWRDRDGEITYVSPDPAVAGAIAERTGRPVSVLVTSKFDILWTLQQQFRTFLTRRAVYGLMLRDPASSAHLRLMPDQWLWVMTIVTFVAMSFLVAPAVTFKLLNVVIGLCFLSVAGLRLVSILYGLWGRPADPLAARAPPEDKDLPVYTVLVPLLREADVLPILAGALKRLDYPASKLDIKFIFEENDHKTIAAAKSLQLNSNFEFIYVPAALPLTKPKACNYALQFARGELLVIFDAEDMPAPDQLRKAAAAFAAGGDELACVQAHLNFFNWDENWLTRQFAIEYASLFDLLLPALDRLGLPIPLGGTSTHFRTRALRRVGAWDPFNVTEDADLGMRLAMHGYKCSVIASTTLEEANCQTGNWIRQRSRWIKGWIQTYAVRMRHPVRLARALGLKGFIGFQIVVGGFVLSSLVHPLLYLLIVLNLATIGAVSDHTGSVGLLLFNAAVLIVGYSLAIFAGMVAVANRGLTPLIWQALTMPAYWLLLSAGAYKGAAQFIARPFYWEKTTHGLSRMTPGQLAKAALRTPPR